MSRETFPVDSSNVNSVEYETDTQQLTVEFKGGRTYQYSGVPYDVWEQLKEADSVGKFVNKNIINKYQTEKL